MKILCCNLITYLYTTSVQISPFSSSQNSDSAIAKASLIKVIKKATRGGWGVSSIACHAAALGSNHANSNGIILLKN